ncbi:uncharacterized protein LOC114768851 isoform X2 [Denticeps clupeoides]|nr:uncharacterized protein LOC114768851 isoform X2 [Denticeps clupeoides]
MTDLQMNVKVGEYEETTSVCIDLSQGQSSQKRPERSQFPMTDGERLLNNSRSRKLVKSDDTSMGIIASSSVPVIINEDLKHDEVVPGPVRQKCTFQDLGKKVPKKNNERKRKRKMDMVVMTDLSEDLFKRLRPKLLKTYSVSKGQMNGPKSRKSTEAHSVTTTNGHSDQTMRCNIESKALGHFPNPEDLKWDPQQEFRRFLWEDINEPVLAGISNDPSSDLNLIPERDQSQEKCSAQMTTEVMGEGCSYGRIHTNIHETDEHSLLKEPPVTDSGCEEFLLLSCTKCNVTFKEKANLHRHSHLDPMCQMGTYSSICKEGPMTVLKERQDRLNKTYEGRVLESLCPCCVFKTNCLGSLVQNAKAHQKDTNKCGFVADTEDDLKKRQFTEHDMSKNQKMKGLPEVDLTGFVCTGFSSRQSYKGFHKSQKHRKVVAHPAGQNRVGKPHTYKWKATNEMSKEKKAFICSDSLEQKSNTQNSKGGQSTFISVQGYTRRSPDSCQDESVGLKNLPVYSEEYQSEEIFCEYTTHNSLIPEGSESSKKHIGDALNHDEESLFILKQDAPRSHLKMNMPGLQNNLLARDEFSDVPIHQPRTKNVRLLNNMNMESVRFGTLEPQENYSLRLPDYLANQISSEMCAEDSGLQNESDSQEELFEDSDSSICLPHYTKGVESGAGLSGPEPGDLTKEVQSPNVSPASVAQVNQRLATVPKDSSLASHEAQNRDLQMDLTCPLCGDCLESSRGLSNHARGHLKRLGKACTSATIKSPLEMLKQLMSNKEEFHKRVLLLYQKPGIAKRIRTGKDHFLSSISAYATKLQNHCKSRREQTVFLGDELHDQQVSTKEVGKCALTIDLIGMLKKRRSHERESSCQKAEKDERSDGMHLENAPPNAPAQKANLQIDLTCPLCGDCLESRRGLSNHARGHLMRLGKACTSTIKSPLEMLKQLMSNKKEFNQRVEAFQLKHMTSKRISTGNDRFLSSISTYGKKHLNSFQGSRDQRVFLGDKAWDSPTPSKEVGKFSPSSDLIGMLKKRKCYEVKSICQAAGKEKAELNGKVCVHCNTTFHSGISLSNHLRAYERRKRAAIHNGTRYDCKQRKQRCRSGTKKKIFSSNSPEELYRLTCRFCDLVFQGPLSVQEDWIKHLQRHIMKTGLPHSGAVMVEVTSMSKEAKDKEQNCSLE